MLDLADVHIPGSNHMRACAPDFLADRHAARARRRAQGLRLSDLSVEQALAEFLPIRGAASFANVVLDTTAPAGVDLQINGNATYTTSRSVSVTCITTDTPTTGYQMKIWGDVDTTVNASIQTTEGASAWITFAGTQAVTLSTGDASKNLNIRIRDDVWNQSGAVTKSITLDTTVPVATIQGGFPDVTKISKVASKNVVTIQWQSDTAIQAYEVAVVSSGASLRGSGVVIGTTNGSTNVSGGAVAATTNVTTTINGTDLQVASAADGTKVIKIFVQDLAGNWSTV